MKNRPDFTWTPPERLPEALPVSGPRPYLPTAVPAPHKGTRRIRVRWNPVTVLLFAIAVLAGLTVVVLLFQWLGFI